MRNGRAAGQGFGEIEGAAGGRAENKEAAGMFDFHCNFDVHRSEKLSCYILDLLVWKRWERWLTVRLDAGSDLMWGGVT